MSCPACNYPHWHVERFSGGRDSAVETRECDGCGYTWTVTLRR
jgi:Zn ribbon nucleic-acid-binding protein